MQMGYIPIPRSRGFVLIGFQCPKQHPRSVQPLHILENMASNFELTINQMERPCSSMACRGRKVTSGSMSPGYEKWMQITWPAEKHRPVVSAQVAIQGWKHEGKQRTNEQMCVVGLLGGCRGMLLLTLGFKSTGACSVSVAFVGAIGIILRTAFQTNRYGMRARNERQVTIVCCYLCGVPGAANIPA